MDALDPPHRRVPAVPAGECLARLSGVTKHFYGKPAIEDMAFDLRRGEVHALLGENGAGKSTLCSVLAGLYRPDAGELVVEDRIRDFRSPHDALAAGVGMVYQHYRLVRPFSVAENLFLGHPALPRRVSRAELMRRAHALVERHGMALDVAAPVRELTVGEQQRVEILRLLARDVRLLILDEPTAVLTPQEADGLYATVRAMTGEGRAVVLVTHKLAEISSVADRITVLRDGRRVATVAAADADRHQLARWMVDRATDERALLAEAAAAAGGRAPARAPAPRRGAPAPAVLAVDRLVVHSDRGHVAVQDVSLEVREGEILGVAGVAGNGQRELADAIAGLRAASAGTIRLSGEEVTRSSVRGRVERGLGYVPEDRLGRGVAAGLPLEDNLIMRCYWRAGFRRGPFLARRAVRRWVAQQQERVEIRGVRDGVRVSILSGGNIQRAILARELADETRVLIACSPSRGLDVGVTASVRDLLRERRGEGLGVLLISEDLEELVELADRIVVMYAGRLVGEVAGGDADPARLGLLMAGSGDA